MGSGVREDITVSVTPDIPVGRAHLRMWFRAKRRYTFLISSPLSNVLRVNSNPVREGGSV